MSIHFYNSTYIYVHICYIHIRIHAHNCTYLYHPISLSLIMYIHVFMHTYIVSTICFLWFATVDTWQHGSQWRMTAAKTPWCSSQPGLAATTESLFGRLKGSGWASLEFEYLKHEWSHRLTIFLRPLIVSQNVSVA